MTKIKIKAIPNAKRKEVVYKGGVLRVYITSSPIGGKANKEIIETLAEFFRVKKNDIKIVRGISSKEKVVDVLRLSE